MSLTFKEEGHLYESSDPTEKIDWLSVTSLVSKFKQPFDAEKQAKKSSKNPRSKWHGIPPEELIGIWNGESKRATDLGTWYHNQREADLMQFETIERKGKEVPIIAPIIQNEVKYAPKQLLRDAVYPEHFVFLKSAGICGQADYVEVVDNVVDIMDYKTNKEIKTKAFTNWEGITQMMEAPLSHLEDCHISHYALQMSIYLYMILKHNRDLKPGTLTINHIVFHKMGDDQYGNPITLMGDNGNPVVKEIVPYELPYLKQEVISLINWRHENKKDAS